MHYLAKILVIWIKIYNMGPLLEYKKGVLVNECEKNIVAS